jgi:hypothetical protein
VSGEGERGWEGCEERSGMDRMGGEKGKGREEKEKGRERMDKRNGRPQSCSKIILDETHFDIYSI